MKKNKPNQKERGITLISLVITIVLLVILAAVVIRALTGDNGLIEAGLTATEEYNIAQDKEKLEQEVNSSIINHMNLGEEVTVLQIAKDLHDQTTWIKSATETEMKDIIVTLQDGNVFEVFYSESYGQAFVEYIGKDDGNSIPTLTANYDEASNSMKVTAEVSGGEIKQVEMFYRGVGQGIKKDNEVARRDVISSNREREWLVHHKSNR